MVLEKVIITRDRMDPRNPNLTVNFLTDSNVTQGAAFGALAMMIDGKHEHDL